MHENVLRKWVRELRDEPRGAFPGNGKQKMERDILKKAAAYFAKESI